MSAVREFGPSLTEYAKAVPASMPTGIVTFLFTDIEGSTKLWERSPAVMREELAAHDRLLREIIERNHGVIFKTVGDECCSAFQYPREALRAAVDVQRALHSYAWPAAIGEIRVRIGIHTGECTERGGDYLGPAVNRVARLMSIAYGEQILVSSATAALVRESSNGDGIALRDLGLTRLKDLSQPEPTFQLVAEGLRSAFPVLASLDSQPNNLPSQISTFVGRDNELKELSAIIAGCRLLTITGPGGIGKTRLALQLGAEVLERYRDGAWFVDLTPVHDAQFVAPTIASAVNVRELPNEPIEQTVVAHFRARKALLIIDNAEHVVAGVAAFARTLLSQCADVTIVTTSRERLHLTGEQIYRVGPLVENGTHLFLERARQAAPSMTLGGAEQAQVFALCEKLEGIPLAIELACARLSAMPLKQLTSRLTSGLALGSKDSTESTRHRTLRGTIDWSYKLLAADEKAALAALSIFRGSCTADAARHVVSDVGDIDDAIDSLVDKSLVQADDAGETTRYRLLDVVREYAHERLDGANESVGSRHADYYAQLVARSQAAPPTSRDYAAFDNDAPNIRAALEWYISRKDVRTTAFIHNLAPYWRERGLLTEARGWISRALEVVVERKDRAMLLCLGASFTTLQDELADSLKLSHEALELFRALDDRIGIAHALFRIGEAVHRQGHLDRAEALYREALEGFRASNDRRDEMICLGNLGMLARQRGELHQACALLEDAERSASELGERRIAGEVAMAMGWVQLGLNDMAKSRKLFERAFAEKRDFNDRYGICCAHHGLATVALKEGRLDDALAEFLATLDAAGELRVKDYVARALHGIAAIEARDGATDAAARFLGLADRLFEESGRELHDSIAYDLAVESLDAAMPRAQVSALREQGAQMHIEDALAEARDVYARRRLRA